MLREKIKEYLKVSGATSGMTDVIEVANNYLLDQLKGEHSADDMKDIVKLNEKYLLLVRGRIDEFQEKFVNLYAEHFTEEDMDALIVFHNSPVAQKMREVGSKILPRAVEISSDFNKELLKQLAGATLDREMN